MLATIKEKRVCRPSKESTRLKGKESPKESADQNEKLSADAGNDSSPAG
jgi:hypothetical protein